jgi:pyruvate dehydrogenase E1 component
LYEPIDSAEIMYCREDKRGQIIEEGICEAGGVSSFIAAGTAYANYGLHRAPCYAAYSMFGFQRVEDFIWVAAVSCARGVRDGIVEGMYLRKRPRPRGSITRSCSAAGG